jgi:hypothetical protein
MFIGIEKMSEQPCLNEHGIENTTLNMQDCQESQVKE